MAEPRLEQRRNRRVQQLPGPGATPFLIWRNRVFMTFLAAVVLVDLAVVAVGLRMSFFYRSLHEQGRTAEAQITRHESRPAIRASDNHFYFYTYQTAAGATHENSTSTRSFDVGDTFPVTYLPETPEDHVLFPMTPSRIHEPIRAALTFAVGSLMVTLLFGTFVQWALKRREKSATG
jgi:hypothetical protein